MTPCLAPDEFVDLVDGTLPPERRAHVDACAACRVTADQLREALTAATADDVPEPSALFWSSINARVREGIAGAPARGWRTWLRWPVVVSAAVAAAALAGVLVLPRATTTAVPDETTGHSGSVPATAEPLDSGATSASSDAALALMIELADELPNGGWDALGIATLPELDVAAASLTDDEQRALAALLTAEVSRSKS